MPCKPAYLMFNAKVFDNFEKGMNQLYAIVCIAEVCKANKSCLDLPLCWCYLLDPMSSKCKIAISVAGLPCVGFHTGTVRVGPGDTVPVPADTIPVQVLHSHCTRIARVMGYTRRSR
jgi:hypothetical protein